ncbi:septal ring lytic transglycosylase RlpA family protein [Arhodomonas sp. AD133]|uniref:septal ring lytic transglycosylase RlpA family protein n=1 Tax=Arhodomonas sp. AD133 TaxID=3415009 RepID=UPI003EBBC3AE
MKRPWRLLLAAASLWLGGCASSPQDGPGDPIGDPGSLPDAVPKEVPQSRYGNPPSYVVFGRRYRVLDSAEGFSQRGVASWYGRKFHGKRTSSGEPYDMYAMTAAHKRLPLPSWVEVKNLDNGRTAVVKVNDRGPFAKGRIIDLSYAAASKLGVVSAGTAPVAIRVVDPEGHDTTRKPPSRQPDAEPAEPEVPGTVDYFVQVGAFSSPDNARRMASSLRDASVSAPIRIDAGTSGERRVYRVRLGPLTDADAADRLGSRLRARGLTGGHVIMAED